MSFKKLNRRKAQKNKKMKTITIESEYTSMFNAYETIAVTNKGIKRTRCISLDKKTSEKWAKEDNERAPYYDKILDCVIYHVTVSEITICTR